jgi:hypothetical protein
MQTYFIRHTETLDVDQSTRDLLWNSKKIAIHFPHYKHKRTKRRGDNRSLNPDDYRSSDAKSIRAICRLAEEGGYVCAEYAFRSECLLGVIEPKTKIKMLKGARNGDAGRAALLKTLTLKRSRMVQHCDLPIILFGRPRRGTIMRWPSAGDVIKCAVEGKRIPPSLDRLRPDQQEVLCQEFLRMPIFEKIGEVSNARMRQLLLPIGRSMRDVDICGITDSGKTLFAQVTFHQIDTAEAKQKLASLEAFSDGGENVLVFFCRCPVPDSGKLIGRVRLISLETVYNNFTTTPEGKRWIAKSLYPPAFR